MTHFTTLPEYDLFTTPPLQLTVDKTLVTEHRPIVPITNYSNPIQIAVNSAIDEYINLKETILYIKLKINIKKKAAGVVTATEWGEIQPVNNLLHSLFKHVDLEIEGKSLVEAYQTYAYKAYFETFLGYTDSAKKGFLDSVGWYDDSGNKNDVQANMCDWIKPTTVTDDGKGKSIVVCGKLHIDLAFQPKILIGGTRLMITLYPNKPEFFLFNKKDTLKDVNVEFEDLALFISKSKVNPQVVEAHNLEIVKRTAKYPIMRGNVKSFSINKDLYDCILDNCVTGQIPRRMFVALVDHEAYSGSLKSNPFKFEHFDLNYITASVDGVQFPVVAYQPDFTNKLYAREFIGLYETLNQLHTDPSFMLTYEHFGDGSTIFGFSFAPDQTDDVNKTGYVNPPAYGSVRLHLKFKEKLPKSINVLVYSEYDNTIEIDASRQALVDYSN